MAIRDKLKKTFGKKPSSGESTPSKASVSEYSYTGRTDVEYYKPHEIPKSKYKGKVDPEHKEQLESFCFGDAFSSSLRRKSSMAMSGFMSPGGTKSQSRRPSYISQADRSARNSVSNIADFQLDLGNETPSSSASLSTASSQTTQGSKDPSDFLDTDLSRQETVKPGNTSLRDTPNVLLEREATIPESYLKPSEVVIAQLDHPFTIDELERALTRASLQADETRGFQTSLVIVAH